MGICSAWPGIAGSHLTPTFTEQAGLCFQVTQLVPHLPGQRPHCTNTKAWTRIRLSGKSQGGQKRNPWWVRRGWVSPCGEEEWGTMPWIHFCILTDPNIGFPGGAAVKNLPVETEEMQETKFRSLGRKDPLEDKMATHSSILAWIISWTEEPGGLQSIGHKELDTNETTENSTCDTVLKKKKERKEKESSFCKVTFIFVIYW